MHYYLGTYVGTIVIMYLPKVLKYPSRLSHVPMDRNNCYSITFYPFSKLVALEIWVSPICTPGHYRAVGVLLVSVLTYGRHMPRYTRWLVR